MIQGYLTEQERNPAFFITVNLSFTHEIGISKRDFDGVNEIETITTSCLSDVDINCFGNNAMMMCQKLKTVFQSSYFLGVFKSMQCGLVSMTDIRNLTATVAGSYEERGQFTLTLSHENIVTTPLKRINLSTQQIIKD